MTTENTNKICPIMLLVGTISETGSKKSHDAKVVLCIKDMCAWWVEGGPSPTIGYRSQAARCGIAR